MYNKKISKVHVTFPQDHLKTTTEAKFDASLEDDKLIVNGVEEDISKNKRVQNCLFLVRFSIDDFLMY